ncbi:MAG TPA: hypothetical protein VMG63_03575 [Terriglobia bacterium]|nr:hypothetical protein [Terriglobia bacterium]
MQAMKERLLRGTAITCLCLLFSALIVRLAGQNVGIAVAGGQPDAAKSFDARPGLRPDSVSDTGIPAGLFGLNVMNPDKYPPLQIGTLGHPLLGWIWIEDSKRVFNWRRIDRFVNMAEGHGLVDANRVVNMVLAFGGTPGWAVSDRSHCEEKYHVTQCTDPPDNIEDWREFVTAVIQHYNGKTAAHIRYYELWNEASIPQYWTGRQEDLVKLAAVAYPIVHSDPYSVLLTPSPAGTDSGSPGWMASYLRAGGSKYADGGTFHGYLATRSVNPYPMPDQDRTPGCGATHGAVCTGSILTQVRKYRRVFDENGLAGKPMYNTEGSWGVDPITDPDMQTAWLARYYLLQASVAVENNLQLISWYCWGCPRPEGKPNWGTIQSETGALTQAGLAYNQVHDWIVGSKMSACSAAGTVWTCRLNRAGGYEALTVWDSAQSCSGGSCSTVPYSPDRRFTYSRNLAGEKKKISTPTVPIGAKPILLENK